MTTNEYDAVIVGASIAGCTAARLLGQSGVRVALLERSADADAYKAMCGHWILGGAKAALERAGFWQPIVDAGGIVGWPSVWAGDGWIDLHVDDVPPSISLRRKTLDPLLRRLAATTPGVDLRLGAEVVGLVRGADDSVRGVTTKDGATFAAPLVIAADGHRSPVARLANVTESTSPNERIYWWAYYEGLEVADGHTAQVWPADPHGAVVTPAGGGLHLVAAFPTKARHAEFAADRVGALERHVMQLPDAPNFARARRVTRAIGTNDYPFVRRDPLPVPGLALIGDAAMASDPLPAVGCGWAIRSAEWLVDAFLADDIARYRACRAIAEQYDDMARQDAAAPAYSAEQEAFRKAARRDPELARRLGLFVSRVVGPEVLFAPASG